MPRRTPLDAWTEQVSDAFPNLSRPQATVLALYSFGMILASGAASTVSSPPCSFVAVGFHTLRWRLQEFSQPPRPIGDPTSGARCHHLLRPFAGLGAQRLAVEAVGLALDATSLGTVFTVWSISVVSRGCPSPWPGRSSPPM